MVLVVGYTSSTLREDINRLVVEAWEALKLVKL